MNILSMYVDAFGFEFFFFTKIHIKNLRVDLAKFYHRK
jgi:hypothetical protein